MLFIGTSGIFGRFVPLEASVAVWWRSAVGVLAILAYLRFRGLSLRLRGRRQYGLAVIAGVLMTGHWITYFYALKLSSVAIGMISIFTFPAMTTLLEPVLLRKPFEGRHLLLALLVVLGVYFLLPEGGGQGNVVWGLVLGLTSAFIYSLRNILMKTQVEDINGTVLMAYQAGVAMVVVSPALLFFPAWPSAEAWPYLLGLGIGTTAIGHTLFLRSFKYFSVSQASLLSCIQPVYGVALAVIFFGEEVTGRIVIGGALVLAAVVVEAVSVMRKG